MSTPIRSASPLWKFLYTQNPFYVISTVLMLYAVRAAYGEIEIGTINCWIMMGVLAAYTLTLATIGVSIVRLGKVWDDARSILLLLVLLFLAVSISADDLFVTSSVNGGTALLVFGYVFSAVTSEAVLRAARIRLAATYRIPYHLMLALFYIAPWWYSPKMHPRLIEETAGMLLLFPTAAAVLLLSLIPAVRRGPAYVARNGTPWGWPWYPWSAFGMLTTAVVLRSYALCMAYGPIGEIWNKHPDGTRSIVFDTQWGTYFLVPLALAIFLLLLEASLVTRNASLQQRLMKSAPVLLLLALPWGGPVFHQFLMTVMDKVCAPFCITVWLLTAFYAWAWYRRVPSANLGAVMTLGLASLVGPHTTGLLTLVSPNPLVVTAISAMLLVHGFRLRSSKVCAAAATLAALTLWLVLPQTALAGYRFTLSYHFLWVSLACLGIVFQDSFAGILRATGALLAPVTAITLVNSTSAAEIPYVWRLLYIGMLSALCLAVALRWRIRWYLYAFGGSLVIVAYAGVLYVFRSAVTALGRPAMTAFSWSIGMLLLAVLISAHKAHWLPRRLFAGWPNGNRSSPPPPQDESVDDPSRGDQTSLEL